MRVAIFGTGGVGGYFGARLAAAGNDVHFIARGAHLAAIRERGLQVESPLGNVAIRPARAHEDTAGIGPVDIVIFAVKLWDVASAAAKLEPVLLPETAVIPFQNGIEAPGVVAGVIGAQHLLGGVAYIATGIRAPGIIAHTGTMARMQIGKTPGAASARFAEACRAAGVQIEVSEDIDRARWEKFVFLSALSGVTSLARKDVGACRADPGLRAMLETAMREAWALGRSRGVALAEDFVAERMRFIDGLHGHMRTSMQHDLEQGNRLEAPWLCGAVARMSDQAGLAAPVSRKIFAALQPYVDGRR